MPRLLTEMMHSYFEEAEPSGRASLGTSFSIPAIKMSNTPVQPIAKSEWEIGKTPRCLRKTFEFSDPRMMLAFLQELLAYEIETEHHGKLTCEFPHVSVEVRTHDVNDVTELDQAYTKTCDQIYEDVKHYELHDGIDLDDQGW